MGEAKGQGGTAEGLEIPAWGWHASPFPPWCPCSLSCSADCSAQGPYTFVLRYTGVGQAPLLTRARLGWFPALAGLCLSAPLLPSTAVGLDNAGKTTILYRLHLGEAVKTVPTIGCNVEQVRPCCGTLRTQCCTLQVRPPASAPACRPALVGHSRPARQGLRGGRWGSVSRRGTGRSASLACNPSSAVSGPAFTAAANLPSAGQGA